ncbi:phage resistance protein [Streptomyces sp. R302]|uniref:BREX-2 system ATPase PglY n=1 Tax=unclassified Streptomyces TaxID=2593676 RepID=UPI00145E0701|nr:MULTISPECIES: phage resistance protein [unclassified Streptomyces]NML54298.1 phage resistance protein [Streptomyces sp. R301]NML78472.1 phage resistance protein [Streptomyces sp. R302]
MAPTAATAPMLRDVIDIKTSISTSDFVLKLAEAVTEEGTERALRDYVVTERLLENFDEALGLIKAALDGHTSKAAYLHGSFGSGKSHFMAVLHALLRGAPAARARADFDPVLAKHEWLGTERKRFLLVPYHMLGAKSLEQRVLGGYVSHVRALHPDAPIPQVYRTDALFEDIRSHRLRMGDDAFINGLSGAETEVDSAAADDEDEWGDSFAWTPAHLDTALSAEELDGGEVNLNLVNPTTPAELRAKLVHDASATWFPGFAKNAAEDEHGFISLDAGLAVIAEHAKSLGYDGLILFMDELILWLANRIHDQKFVSREADKITNFVEGADSRRAIPIVSFIARQRDLRELVGEETSGAAETAIQDSLNLASGRFDKITLEDRNLPQIAHARLLRPKNAEAAAKLDAAFAKIKRVGPQVWDVLLGSEEGTTGADEDSFRLTYPFSPAFMDTLVHISSALQRSRTGLKLMGQLLANHRDDATLEQLIPLGDLYPVIADGGDKPFVDALKVEFKAADKLYRSKLRPHLLATYEVTEEDIERYRHRPGSITDPQLLNRCKGFIGDNRLMCTLLLSALAPSVPALRDLTIRRLGALNHGSVVSPIPGAEVGVIKAKVDEWAANFAEIKPTGTTANPGVRLELAGVDVDSVIANAKANNNRNNRLALARRLLEEELGVERQEQLSDADDLRLVWRGSNRTVEVVFGYIADTDQLPDHDLAPSQEGLWRLVVDLPYDEGEFGPRDDVNRMQKLRERPGMPPRTVAWIPTHLSAARYKDFERLVTIDYALADPRRFDTMYAQHLNADNRARAKGLLEGQRNSLVKSVKAAFKQAYGLAAKAPADVNVSFNDHFESLREVPDLRVSIGQSLSDAARHIASKLLAQQFPAHPDLDPEGRKTAVRPADARTVFGYIRAAVEAGDRQAEIPNKDRDAMRRIAAPLGLGQQKEAYFRLSNRWVEHFALQARTDGGPGDLSVVQLTDWIDRPEPMGLETFLANLVIASYAEMDDRVWVRSGALLDPAPELSSIKPIDALRSQPLPDESVWEEAGRRYWDMFGEKPPTLRRGRIVGQFARQILGKAREYQQPADTLVTELEKHAILLGLDGSDEAGRLALARRSRDLLDELKGMDRGAAGGAAAAKQVITAFAGFDLGEVSAGRYGASIKQAQTVASALATTVWDMLKLAPSYGPEGEAVLERLRRAAQADQRTENLKDELERAGKSIIEVIRRSQAAAAPAPQPPVPVAPEPVGPRTPNEVDLSTETSHPPVPTSHPAPGRATRRSGGGRTKASQALAELRAELAELMESEPDATVEISWRVVE